MRGVSFITAVFLLLAAFTAQAQFDSTIVNGAVIITGYDGPDGPVTIPTNINNLPVVSIAGEAFYEQYGVTSVTIPDTVTNIGDYAFYDCAALNSITLPAGLAALGNCTFEGCTGLTSITLPPGVTTLGNETFGYCSNLANVTLSPCLCAIAFEEFVDCVNLTNVNIPNCVNNIDDYAFSGCARLNNINIPGCATNIGYGAFLKCSSLSTLTIPNGVTNIGQYAFYNCTNLSSIYFNGNMPCCDSTVFVNDRATAYYLPGAGGWNSSFSGIPTAQWALPYPVILNSSMGINQQNAFGFTVSWATNGSVGIQASSDLANHAWTTISLKTLSNGSCYYEDVKWSNYHARFYRVTAATP